MSGSVVGLLSWLLVAMVGILVPLVGVGWRRASKLMRTSREDQRSIQTLINQLEERDRQIEALGKNWIVTPIPKIDLQPILRMSLGERAQALLEYSPLTLAFHWTMETLMEDLLSTSPEEQAKRENLHAQMAGLQNVMFLLATFVEDKERELGKEDESSSDEVA